MSRYPATLAELEQLKAHLAGIAPEHHPAIAEMVFEVVDDCPRCSEAVRRCDSRRLVEDERLAHIRCLGGP